MAKKSKRKQHAKSEKENAGCMSGLISIFDFRQGRSTQRQLSDRRHGSAKHAGDAGSKYSKAKLNLLASSVDMDKRSKGVDASERRLNVATCAKVLTEEEMSRVQVLRKISKSATVQTIPSEVVDEMDDLKASETSILYSNLHIDDKSIVMPDNSVNLCKISKFYSSHNLAALLEEICSDSHQCHRLLADLKSIENLFPSHGITEDVLCNFHPLSGVQVIQDCSTVHKMLIEVVEALIHRDIKTLHATSHHSEDLVNSLGALNSEELLLKLLQGPCSVSGQHMPNISSDLEGKSSQPESYKLFEVSNVSPRKCEEPTTCKILQQKGVHDIVWKKDKMEEKDSKGNDNAKPLTNIVVLKPTPSRSQDSSIASSPGISRSCQGLSLRTEAEKERVASQISLKEIKRRLRRVIGDNGKGRHILSVDGTLHRFPYQLQQSRDSGSKWKDSEQGKSAIKTFRHKEYPYLSFRSNRKGNQSKLKASQTITMHEAFLQDKILRTATTTTPHQEYNFQQEARKHLMEVFNIVDNEASLLAVKTSKPLWRMLSLSEYNLLSPRTSLEREKESCISPRQMRCSPLFHLKQETEKLASPHKESIADTSSSRTRTLEHASASMPDIQEQSNPSREILKEENVCNGEFFSSKGCTMVVEHPDGHAQDRDIVEMVFESNIGNSAKEIQRSEELPLSPRSTTMGAAQTVDLSVTSTPIMLLAHNIRSPDSTISEKPERPSPVSVLEPLFTEDCSSPVPCNDEHVDFQGQPPPTCHAAHEDSAVVFITSCHEDNQKTCLEEKECRFEYVKDILEASGLPLGLLSDKWHSYPLLDESLYDEVEYKSDEFPDDLRQLFDSTNEVLEVLHQKLFCFTPWVSLTKPGVRPIPLGENFIEEVWKGVDRCFSFHTPQTLNQIMSKDVEVGPWMDLRSGIESIVIDIGDTIIDGIVEDFS